jgi:hypothetical protein
MWSSEALLTTSEVCVYFLKATGPNYKLAQNNQTSPKRTLVMWFRKRAVCFALHDDLYLGLHVNIERVVFTFNLHRPFEREVSLSNKILNITLTSRHVMLF